MPLLRYPGSKTKLVDKLIVLLPERVNMPLDVPGEYREPFVGAMAMGWQVMRAVKPRGSRFWLNDADPGVAALWTAVRHHPKDLLRRVRDFMPTVEAFYDFKARDGVGSDPVDVGFRKLAIHRISVSGFGVKAGGPIGGRSQNTEYPVGCRWMRESIAKEIIDIHNQMRRFDEVRITCGDFEPLIHEPGDNVCIYLDPPYYEKGAQLYKFSMSDDDHKRLAGALRESTAKWVLSYDDHPVVRGLYDWATIEELSITYTNATGVTTRRPKNKELVITP